MNLFQGCTDRDVPRGMTWLRESPEWSFDHRGRLTIVPEAVSDFFRPYGEEPNDNACLLYAQVTGDFTAVTRAEAVLAGGSAGESGGLSGGHRTRGHMTLAFTGKRGLIIF